LNYRHAFHAGNFADLAKHVALLQLLQHMLADKAPLTVIDTHAGRGVYDLAGPEARKSGEAEAGIARLMAADHAPAAFGPLLRAVERLNGGREPRRYPGSPSLIAEALRPVDRYLACELRPDEHAALRALMQGRSNVSTLCADGYQAAVARCPPTGPVLALIDPPFERADDYGRIVDAAAGLRKRNPRAAALVWLPLKDLETFDAFLRDLEDRLASPALVAEVRMRPLTDPMKMNGCALVMLNAPDIRSPLSAACAWIAEHLGEAGAARTYNLSGL